MTIDPLQALSDDIAEMRLSVEAFVSESREATRNAAVERAELREATLRVTNLAEGIANLVVSLDDDRPTILGRLSRIEGKVDQLLQQRQIDGGTF
jgi:hypothetical protein